MCTFWFLHRPASRHQQSCEWVKGRTSRKHFEEFPHVKKRYWGKHFWALGYFCVTAGDLTKEMIEEYLSHHFEPKPSDRFDIEP